MLETIRAQAARLLEGRPEALSVHLLTNSRHKRYAAGRLIALVFAGEAPALVACFQRDAGATAGPAHERAILEALAPAGLAPRSYGIEWLDGRPVHFQEALPGPHAGGKVARAALDPEALRPLLAAELAAAGRFLTALQAQRTAGAPACPHPAVTASGGDYVAAFGLSGVESELLTGLLADYEGMLAAEAPVWLHGDLTLSNLATGEDGVRAFDWEYGGVHPDRHRDAMHLAYYAFVSVFHLGGFAGRDFHQAFGEVFLEQRHWLSGLVRELTPGLPPERHRQALLACLVQDALLQRQVSLVFAPENAHFHRRLIGQVLGYELFRAELAEASGRVAALEAQLAAEAARAQALEARVPALEAESAGLAAERSAIAQERDALAERAKALEGELAALESRHAALERHAHELGMHLDRINSRWVMRLYRRLREGVPRPQPRQG